MAAQTGADSAAVRALAVIGSDLYVGGDFIKNWAATLSLNRIARYDTIGQAWHPLAENGIGGASSNVFALAVSGSDLYVGGLFIQTTDNTTPGLNATARYSGGAWSALAENGLNNNARALAVSGSDVYVGGDFTGTSDGTTTGLKYIARFSTSDNAWHALAENGLNAKVNALAVIGSDLYVGGLFIQTTDNTTPGLNAIARYSGGAWSALAENGLKKASAIGVVYALAVSPSGDLYVGGDFIKTIDNTTPNLNFIARYSGGVWSALNGHGLDSIVRAIAVTATDLYAGGEFSAASDSSVTALFFIARHGPGTTAVTLASFQAAPAFDLWAWLAGWLR